MPENAQDRAGFTYTAAADFYDASPLGFSAYFGRRTIELASLPSGSRVLAVCRGTGASAPPTAEAIGPTGNVIAVDFANVCNTADLARCFCPATRKPFKRLFETSESTPALKHGVNKSLPNVHALVRRTNHRRTVRSVESLLKFRHVRKRAVHAKLRRRMRIGREPQLLIFVANF